MINLQLKIHATPKQHCAHKESSDKGRENTEEIKHNSSATDTIALLCKKVQIHPDRKPFGEGDLKAHVQNEDGTYTHLKPSDSSENAGIKSGDTVHFAEHRLDLPKNLDKILSIKCSLDPGKLLNERYVKRTKNGQLKVIYNPPAQGRMAEKYWYEDHPNEEMDIDDEEDDFAKQILSASNWERHKRGLKMKDDLDENNEPVDCYNTIDGIKGPFIIFNYKHFEKHGLYSIRKHANKLAAQLAEMAIHLGFSPVRIFNDLTTDETKKWLEIISHANLADINCIGCAISSHGNGKYVKTYDGKMRLSDFYDYIGRKYCRLCQEIPKLFFVQACRGKGIDHGKTVTNKSVDGVVESSNEIPYTLPSNADTFIYHSSSEDMKAYRTMFIPTMCEQFKLHCNCEIMKICQKVNKEVANDERESDNGERLKQMPAATTHLRKALYFGPKSSQDVSFRKRKIAESTSKPQRIVKATKKPKNK